MYMADSFALNGSIIIRIESETIPIYEVMAPVIWGAVLCDQVLLLLTNPRGCNFGRRGTDEVIGKPSPSTYGTFYNGIWKESSQIADIFGLVYNCITLLE